MVLMENFEVDSELSNIDRSVFLINSCLETPELSDELYCIVIKQMNMNPKPQSVKIGWKILSFLLSFFPPSSLTFKYILRYFYDEASETLKTYIARSFTVGPRKTQISSRDILFEIMNKTISFKVNIPGAVSKSLTIDSLTTISDVLFEIMESFKVKNYIGWNIFQQLENNKSNSCFYCRIEIAKFY
jgi:hypothetical protein